MNYRLIFQLMMIIFVIVSLFLAFMASKLPVVGMTVTQQANYWRNNPFDFETWLWIFAGASFWALLHGFLLFLCMLCFTRLGHRQAR